VLSVVASVPAHAQLGALRRAAQRAASGGAAPAATPQAATTQPASAGVGGSNVLELTAPVLDRFQRALAAESADRAQLAQRLAAVKTPEQYSQCNLAFYQSAAGQAEYAKLNAASERNDQTAMMAAAEAVKAAMERACGADPSERGRIQNEAQAHAEQAGLAAGEFTPRQYAVVKERIVPFCRAAAQAGGEGDVRLPGSGRNVFYVYTAAEAAALRERCGALMQALASNS
jgi:hypothetical protein